MNVCKSQHVGLGWLAVHLLLGFGLVWGVQAARAQNLPEPFSRRIMAGDRLNISVREQPDMSRVYAVAGDGSIDFAFAGRVVIAELTSD